MRKAVYATISALRHEMNGVRPLEPTSWDVAAYLAASKAPKPGP